MSFVCPVILTGRDASGQPFREETETSIVNLHGALLRTTHQVLVGMLVVVENARTGVAEKAVCVMMGETPAGQTAHDIAVQLLKPQNLWGMEAPPDDWATVEERMVRGTPASAAGPPTAAKASVPPAPPFPSVGGMARGPVTPSADVAFADLKQRSAQLMESVLQNLHQRAEEIVANALRRFQEQIDGIAVAAEARVNERSDQAFAELESALATFRADVGDELAARTEQVVEATEKALRSKVVELSRAVDKSAPDHAPSKTSDPASRP